MRNIASLSLEQAPPYHIPLRFFVTAPVFAMVAALVLLYSGSSVFESRWSPAALAITHLLTLGYASMVMLGAMLQMLPVLAGVRVRAVVLIGSLVHLLIVSGGLLLAAGFLWLEHDLLLLAAVLLTAGITLFVVAVGMALLEARTGNATLSGMKFALTGLLAVLVLGVLITSGFTGWTALPALQLWTDVHLSWGVVGWFAVLLISVSYQVVPMFQVTPEYPGWIRRWLIPVLLVTLVAWNVASLTAAVPVVRGLLLGAMLLELVVFALVTLWLFSRRKRKVPDNTLLFWRTGIAVFVIIVVLLAVDGYKPWLQLAFPLGVLIVPGVMLTMINGMLYRIVPFLSWFHLQHAQVAAGRFDIQLPHMKSFITDKAARRQYYVHLASLLCMLTATVMPEVMTYPAGILFFISNLLLFLHLVRSWLKHSAAKSNLFPAAT